MWVDHPVTRAEKISVLMLEAEQRKLRARILSLTATLRNANRGGSNLMRHQLHYPIHHEVQAFLFMMVLILMHLLMVGVKIA